jgi:glycosyltransferase involved in cell wall biosynthesis
VVRDRGGPRELVWDQVSGYVTPSDDAFVEACRRLVEDRLLRIRMGRAAWEHASRMPTWDRVIERLMEVLAGVAARSANFEVDGVVAARRTDEAAGGALEKSAWSPRVL